MSLSRVRRCLMIPVAALGLVACGGSSSPADVAANACIQWAQTQLAGKPLGADAAALAASMKPADGDQQILSAPVKVNAGLAAEETQTLECTVRIAGDGKSADVVVARFIW